MRSTLRILCTGLLAALFTAGAPAAQDLSSIPGAFVDVGFGARPVALGSAYAGLADDAHSIMWNPAGMARHTSYNAAFSYIDQLGLVDYQYAAITAPLSAGVQGAGLAVIASGDEMYREMAIYGGYARAFDRVAVGINVKYRRASFGNNTMREEDYAVFDQDEIQQGMAAQVRGSAGGFGLDVGMLFQAHSRLSVGLMLRDVLAPVSWNSENNDPNRPARGSYSERLPFEAAVGTVYHVTPSFLVSADYNPALSDEVSNKVRVGAEATFLDLLSLRAGMQQFVNDQRDEKYALGFGLQVPLLRDVRIYADYTYLIEELANSQHVSLAVSF